MIAYLPLLAAFGCCLALLLPAVDDGADLVVTRVALSLFGDYVGEDGPRRQRQRDLMRAAHVAGTHRTYAAKTLLYAGVLGVAGSVIGVYAAAGLLSVLDVSEAALRGTLPASLGFVAGVTRLTELGLPKLFLLLTLASATLGAALAVGMYYGRWELLDQRAHARERRSTPPCPGRSRSCTRSRGRGCRSHASWTRSRRTRRCTARRRRSCRSPSAT